MAEIRRFLWMRHLRAEPSVHVLRFKRGRLTQSGRGLAFWFLPMSASVAEVPMDDRDLHFLFHARSRDFQDVTVQGVAAWRVTDPEKLGARLDFSIDLAKGAWLKQPLEQVDGLLTGMAQQLAVRHVADMNVKALLAEGVDLIQQRIADGLLGHAALAAMGIEVVAVRVADVAPTPDLEKALQTPTREQIQQAADEATFQRRAQAVDKERAIAENELQNRIELARREQQLIEQKGQNDRKQAVEAAEAARIAAEGKAERDRIESDAQARRIQVVEQASLEAERGRMDIYAGLPPNVMLGLAARELAGNLPSIEHLNLSPDALGPMLQSLLSAGTRRLEAQ